MAIKHKKHIDMIKWKLPAGDQPTPTRAVKCVLNPGVLDSSGDQISHPARIRVDDALIAALGATPIKMALADVTEAIFMVLGQLDLKYRQCLLAMAKWHRLIVVEHQLTLGLIWSTRRLTITIPRD